MNINIINTDKAPAAIGPYSQAVSASGFLYSSGQLGIDPATGMLAEGIKAQTERAIINIGEVLAAAGLSYSDVVKTTCYLTDISDFSEFNEIYARYFTGKPARSCISVASLPRNASVVIEVTAALS